MRAKLIGQSPEYYKLYEILRKLERFTQLAPHVGWNTGGGTTSPTTTGTTTLVPMTFVDIPDAPSFGSSQTHNYVNPGNIVAGTNNDKFLGTTSNWEQIRYFSLTGTVGSPFRITNAVGATFIGAFANNYLDLAGSNTEFVYTYGRTAADPLVLNLNSVSTGAIRFLTDVSSTFLFQNIVAHNGGLGLQMNDTGTLSGGDAVTPPVSTDNYTLNNVSFLRMFEMGAEGFYIGVTSTIAAAIHQEFNISHCLACNTGWDPFQFNWHKDLHASNITAVNGGLLNVAAQNNLLQLQNVIGIVENSIFKDAPHLFTIASHNLVIRNNYFRWTDGFAGLIQDYYAAYGTCCRLTTTPVQILIEDNDFVCDNATPCDALLDALDPNVTITVRNCRMENINNEIFLQGTGGNLVDGGGNTFVPPGTILTPTITNFDPTDYLNHGLLTDTPGGRYHWTLHRGYRTP